IEGRDLRRWRRQDGLLTTAATGGAAGEQREHRGHYQRPCVKTDSFLHDFPLLNCGALPCGYQTSPAMSSHHRLAATGAMLSISAADNSLPASMGATTRRLMLVMAILRAISAGLSFSAGFTAAALG